MHIPPALIAILASTLLGACTPAPRVVALDGQSMGSTWSVKYVGEEGTSEAMRAMIAEHLDRVDRQMSTWKADSDLSAYNAAPAGTWQPLPIELFTVLDTALRLASDTDGAYDPTVGPLVNLWGFGPDMPRREPPDAAAIEALRAQVGWQRVQLDAARHRALQPGAIHIDLSSIAPGFAVDDLAAALEARGVTRYLIEVGGELRAAGTKPDGSAWQVAIQRPLDNDSADDAIDAAEVVALRDQSIGSSGDYRHFFEDNGRRYAHRIDPRTGFPLDNQVASVTVMRARCIDADSLATALSVLGVDDGMAYARARGIAALFIVRVGDGFEEHMTPAFAARIAR